MIKSDWWSVWSKLGKQRRRATRRKVPLSWTVNSMTLCKNYYIAQSVQGALEALDASPGPARIVAGGTDLLLDVQQGRHSPIDTLVDITQIPELLSLGIRQGEIFVGAGVLHNQIIASSIVQGHAQALFEACSLIGGPQVRNTATLGGNVAHALPAADGTIALIALGAEVEIASIHERCRVPLERLFKGPGKSTLDPLRELILGFYLPLREHGQASAFKRVMRPQGVAIAILNTAAWIQRRSDTIADLRISVGPSGPVPRRMIKTADFLRGKEFHAGLIEQAAQVLLSEASFRTSRHRATSEYRHHMAKVLLKDTLSIAWERALQ
jgi:carbon-monoxide dehydrogenase medium subunit